MSDHLQTLVHDISAALEATYNDDDTFYEVEASVSGSTAKLTIRVEEEREPGGDTRTVATFDVDVTEVQA